MYISHPLLIYILWLVVYACWNNCSQIVIQIFFWVNINWEMYQELLGQAEYILYIGIGKVNCCSKSKEFVFTLIPSTSVLFLECLHIFEIYLYFATQIWRHVSWSSRTESLPVRVSPCICISIQAYWVKVMTYYILYHCGGQSDQGTLDLVTPVWRMLYHCGGQSDQPGDTTSYNTGMTYLMIVPFNDTI